MNKIIELAKAELGYSELPPDSNRTKFGKWFGFDGVAWCAMFVSWCYHHAGFPLGNIGFKKGMAGCQTAVAHYRQTGEITTTPVAGDIVFFDFNGDERFDHVGIFIRKLDADYFESIEGNTSIGNNANGGKVMLRRRSYGRVVFVHPKILD